MSRRPVELPRPSVARASADEMAGGAERTEGYDGDVLREPHSCEDGASAAWWTISRSTRSRVALIDDRLTDLTVDCGVLGPVERDNDPTSLELSLYQLRQPVELEEAEIELEVNDVGVGQAKCLLELRPARDANDRPNFCRPRALGSGR